MHLVLAFTQPLNPAVNEIPHHTVIGILSVVL